jgi:hypothetical protein
MTSVVGVVALMARLESSIADPLVNSTIPLRASSKIICAIYRIYSDFEIYDGVLLSIDLKVKILR